MRPRWAPSSVTCSGLPCQGLPRESHATGAGVPSRLRGDVPYGQATGPPAVQLEMSSLCSPVGRHTATAICWAGHGLPGMGFKGPPSANCPVSRALLCYLWGEAGTGPAVLTSLSVHLQTLGPTNCLRPSIFPVFTKHWEAWWLRVQPLKTWIQIPAWRLPSCVTWDKLLKLSVPLWPYL